MYERLTYWNEEYGCWSYKCASGDAAKCLAAYEDSGMSPEEITKVIKSGVPEWIDKYLEYRKLEAEGRLVVLPCKVGDKVYYLTGRNVAGGGQADFDKVKESNVQGFYMNGDSLLIQLRYWVGNHGTYGLFGKTVFLTKEAAEKALGGTEDGK